MRTARSLKSALICLAAVAVLSAPALARASDDDEPARVVYDARLEGLKGTDGKIVDVSDPKNLMGNGTVVAWLILAFCSAATVGVMFKDARRSHLD
jgi:hypothetical protein